MSKGEGLSNAEITDMMLIKVLDDYTIEEIIEKAKEITESEEECEKARVIVSQDFAFFARSLKARTKVPLWALVEAIVELEK